MDTRDPDPTARRTTLNEERTSYAPGDAAERIAAVWQLSLRAWQIKTGRSDEPHVQRDLVRILRRS